MSLAAVVSEYQRSTEPKPSPKKPKIVKLVNVLRFAEADVNRKHLLELVPDRFIYEQAMIAWDMNYMQVKAQTTKMRKWQLVTLEKRGRDSIFIKIGENGMKQSEGYTRRRFKQGQKNRLELLALLPDQFTPVQAMEVWEMSRETVDSITQKMRKWNLITPNKGNKGRIFTKVKDQENAN
jgi:hypothetical protein